MVQFEYSERAKFGRRFKGWHENNFCTYLREAEDKCYLVVLFPSVLSEC